MSDKLKTQKIICFINDYMKWDDTIHEHACIFNNIYSVYPNLMLASKTTWKKIDKYANLFNPDNIKASESSIENINLEEEIKTISCFTTSDYSIEFCFDEKVKEDYFILVFDEEPIFDGEPVDDDTTEVYRRIA
ncbi:MAG: hypothetical protein KBA61_00050 [Spirochaetes bacterium]|nr:hypothetical protein [Spirochaetota bacterium]